MLLADQRTRLINLCLAGMQMAWFVPLLPLLSPALRRWPLWGIYAGLLAVLIAWLLALEMLNRRPAESPGYELSVAGLVTGSAVAAAAVGGAAAGLPPTAALGHLLDFSAGMPAPLALMLADLFLWQRATSATSRELSFFNVGLSFRSGLLLLLVTASAAAVFAAQPTTPLLWLYLGFGLVAVATARVDEKAGVARSSGTPLPTSRLVHLLLAVAATIGLSALASLLYTGESLAAVVHWLQPLWSVLGFIATRLLIALFFVLSPALEWLQRQALKMDLTPLSEALRSLQAAFAQNSTTSQEAALIPGWIWNVVRDIMLGLLALAVLALILLFLRRLERRSLHDQAEDETAETATFGGGMIGKGARRLRELLGLARRYGVNRQLLAAVSVQNIYANLCRLARQRGYPRQIAQPPDDYLPVLTRAFPGQDPMLQRITAAYMRVHYGDRPASAGELAQLRADYQQVRQAARETRAARRGQGG